MYNCKVQLDHALDATYHLQGKLLILQQNAPGFNTKNTSCMKISSKKILPTFNY